jgi:TRAP-type C4-dicarboxylate transport system substrate-binding protein
MNQVRRTAIAAAALVAFGLPGLAAGQQHRMNLADAYPQTEFINQNMQKWGEEIRAATNGAVQINMHFAGSLFKNPDIKRAVQTGQVEFGTQLMQNLGPEKRLFELDGLPFFVNSYDEGEKLWQISRPALSAYLEKQGLRLLYAAPWPSQGFFFKKEVNSLSDISGERQRAYNEMTSSLAKYMHTVPTTVQMTELTQAMTTGTIQLFNTSPTSAVVFKAWEFTTHFYDTNAWLPKQMVFVNEAAFKKLPPQAQDAILKASATADKRGWEMSRQKVDEARKELAAKGMKVVKPGPKLQAEFDKIGEQMLNDWLQKADDDGKKVVAEFRKSVKR